MERAAPGAPPVRTRHVLVLLGVSAARLARADERMGDSFDQRVLADVPAGQGPAGAGRDADADAGGARGMPLPAVFTTLAEWPATTGLRCWSCHRIPAGVPLFAPVGVRATPDGGLAFDRAGVACSLPCAQALVRVLIADTDERLRAQERLRALAQQIYGAAPTVIRPAPPVTVCAEYGGPLPREKYWEAIDALHAEALRGRPTAPAGYQGAVDGGPPAAGRAGRKHRR
jgi:hypothetical protein